MGALKIECYCNEDQMNRIVKAITTHLYESEKNELSDFDEEIEGVRVCVDFETILSKVAISASEILDKDWNLLYEDSAVLTSRLKSVINEYNKNSSDAYQQAEEILQDQEY